MAFQFIMSWGDEQMGTPNSCLTHYLINSSFSYLLHFKLPTEKVYHSVPPAAGNFKKKPF